MEIKYCFQNCQKIVLFRNNNSEVLLARRKGENDYDGTYSFVGGKMENDDGGLVEGIKKKKNEEIGKEIKIKLYPDFNTMEYFVKKSGDCMVLPHYYAEYISGDIVLNDEYSDYKWVTIDDLENFEPKIEDVFVVVKRLLRLLTVKGEGIVL